MSEQDPLLLGTVLLAALVLPGCRPPRAVLGPVPADIREIEGDASLKLTRNGETSRSRFAFVLGTSGRGRVVVTDFLGGAAAEFVFAGDDGYLVLPSQKGILESGSGRDRRKASGIPADPGRDGRPDLRPLARRPAGKAARSGMVLRARRRRPDPVRTKGRSRIQRRRIFPAKPGPPASWIFGTPSVRPPDRSGDRIQRPGRRSAARLDFLRCFRLQELGGDRRDPET